MKNVKFIIVMVLSIKAILLFMCLSTTFAKGGVIKKFAGSSDWTEVELFEVSGVPNEPNHHYSFRGVIKVEDYPNYEKVDAVQVWVEGSGEWDERKKEAVEKFNVKGVYELSYVATFRCLKDPWLVDDIICAVMDAKINFSSGDQQTFENYDFIKNVHKMKKPFTTNIVTLDTAEALSNKSASQGSQ